MKSIIRMIAVLSLLCALSGFVLSYLKITTAPRIEEQVLNYVQGPALTLVFPDAENSPLVERHTFTLDGRDIIVFPAKKDGKLYGVALENSATGPPPPPRVMVGFVTTMKETPGIGTNVAEPAFTNQFRGLDLPVGLSSQGGNVDAVSGATVSSTGAVNAIRKATDDYQALKEQILAQWS